MADINEILGRQINSVKELKSAISELQNSLIGVDTESEQYKTTSQQLTAAQAELTKVTRAGKEENNAAADSIRGMEKEYKALYDQYKMLTEEQRNSDIGKNMAASLETLSNKLNETKKEVGNFKDNIGRYAESAGEAFNGMGLSIGGLQTPLKLATGGANTFGTALKSLAANPIVLVITALVAILAKAAEAIKKNEQLSNRLNQALAALKPVTDALANVFDFLAGMIVKAVEGMSKAVEWISKISPKWNAAVKSHKELAKATNELTKAQRENSVVASEKTAEIERLRQEASATDDVVEKKRLLEEAKKMQQEVDQREIELAQEELRILQEYADKTANSAEDNEKLAAAQKKVNDAIAKGEQNMRQYNKQLNTVDNSVKKTTTSTTNYRDEAKKLHEQLIESNKDEITKLTEKYEKEKKLLTKYGYDTTLLTQKYEREKAEIYQKNAADTYNKLLTNYEKQLDAEKRHRDNLAKLDKMGFETDAYELTKLQYDLKALDTWWKTVTEDSELFKNFYEEGNWSSIPDSFKDFPEVLQGLHEQLINLNKTYGITIENATDLKDNINITNQAILDFWERYTIATIEKRLKDFNWDSINEEMTMMFGGFDPAAIAIEKARNSYGYLELEKKILQEELANWKGSYDKKVELMTRLYEIQEELLSRQADLDALNKERWSETIESFIDLTDKMGSAINTYRSSQEALIDSEVKAGYISEKEGNKKKKRLLALQRAERDFSIATITADAAAGIFSIWKGYATEVGTINPQTAAAAGPGAAAALGALNTKSLITAVAKTASLASTAAAQIAAAQNGYITAKNNLTAEEAAASPSVAATPNLIDSTPYSYARTIQTTEEEAELNRPIYVTVTDIEDGLGQRVKVTNESSF